MAKYMLILGGADLDKRSQAPGPASPMLERYFTWLRSLEQRLTAETGLPVTIADRPLQCVVLGAGATLDEAPLVEARPRRRRARRRR